MRAAHRHHHRDPARRGQASILMGMMMLTFIFFFAFVVNTGMLVNAKINLQNAADLAAYAGAAVQARQLNEIAHLNYEMRRTYKKFLFRYYVLGTMGQKSFPITPRASPAGRVYNPDPADPTSVDYLAPSVCIVFNETDNYCQRRVLGSIKIPPSNPLDQINEALRRQLGRLEEIRQRNCGEIGFANQDLLILWLFNTDPRLEALQAQIEGNDAASQGLRRRIDVIRGLSFGLGLIPREILLRSRIRTLEKYVNAEPVVDARTESVNALARLPSAPERERTISAFRSAYLTLGNHAFPGETVAMDELQPPQLLKLEDAKVDFDAYSVAYELTQTVPPGGAIPADGTPEANLKACAPRLFPTTVRGVPIGVGKDPKTLTYYALRLRAQPKLMFWPFRDVELKAYAAARPFGSRLGPPARALRESATFPFSAGDLPAEVRATSIGYDGMVNQLPNLPVLRDESDVKVVTRGMGFDTTLAVSSLYAYMDAVSGGAPGARVIGQRELNRGYQAGTAPNPWEGKRYNIPSDVGNDAFARHFDRSQVYALWAPVAPAGENPTEALSAVLDEIFQPDTVSGLPLDAAANAQRAALKLIIRQGLGSYVERLRTGQGEGDGDGTRRAEGFNVAILRNSFVDLEANGGERNELLPLPPELMMREPKEWRTGWDTQRNPLPVGERTPGRTGYSVKFVPLGDLVNGRIRPSNEGNVSMGNTLAPPDDESIQDLNAIKH